jgi:hypothetical protein
VVEHRAGRTKLRVVARWIPSWRAGSIETGGRSGRAPLAGGITMYAATGSSSLRSWGYRHPQAVTGVRITAATWNLVLASSSSPTATSGPGCCSPYRPPSSRPPTSWPGERPDPGAAARTSMKRFPSCVPGPVHRQRPSQGEAGRWPRPADSPRLLPRRYPASSAVDALRASMNATRNWRRSSGSGFSISRAVSVIPAARSSVTT